MKTFKQAGTAIEEPHALPAMRASGISPNPAAPLENIWHRASTELGLWSACEAERHPHVEAELPGLFRCPGDGPVAAATEYEVLNQLNALVLLDKPVNVLELGTGRGAGTLAIASALAFNRRGRLTTVEKRGAKVRAARRLLRRYSLEDAGDFRHTDSFAFIDGYAGTAFDFVFFDTDVSIRHLEFRKLHQRGLLNGLAVFHDTSRLRGRSARDFNPQFIAGLDAIDAPGLEFPLSRGLRIFQVKPGPVVIPDKPTKPAADAKTPPDRDQSDAARLWNGRRRDVGFVGSGVQSPPMLFTREGHSLYLGDLYRGSSAFLLCGGPSLTSHDLGKLRRPGILTCAVNNAATVFRPNLWTSVDDPGNFSDAIWRDPAIMKFVPLSHMEKPFMVRDAAGELVPSREVVGDMPAMFGFRRNEKFVVDQWLREDSFNWGNHADWTDEFGNTGSRSVMYVALRLLHHLGVRKLYLVGCDFRMEFGKRNYAFEQDRSRGAVRGNNESYRILNQRLEALRPHFEAEGYFVFNCTPDSGLTVFEHVPFDEAVGRALESMPKSVVTVGMYDRKAREREERAAASAPSVSAGAATGSAIPEFTVVVAVDEVYSHRLKYAWPTWMKFKPELRTAPIVVVHDAGFDPRGEALAALADHPNLRFVPWSMDNVADQREKMLTALVRAPGEHVRTPWYLKLDADVAATAPGQWIRPEWFAADSSGRTPVFVSSPWGYTKPADAIRRLDDWGNTVEALRRRPALNLAAQPGADLIRHPRIISWCFFGDTAWTREVAAYAPDRLPVPSQDTYLFYCAARRGDRYVRADMSSSGWKHLSQLRRLRMECMDLLAANP